MSAKIPLSPNALRRHLAEQIAFLKVSAASFDAGFEGEAKRLAVAIRVLVYDTSASRSLMEQLGIKNRDFVDTSFDFDSKNLLSHESIVGTVIGSAGTRYVAMLDNVPAFKNVAFDVWWNKPVFVDKDRRTLTRKDVVLVAANQDGGAHVDPALDARYAELAESLGWVAVDNGLARIMEGAERAAIRQIAHELLKTLVPDYSKNMPDHEGILVAQPMLVQGGSENLPPASVAPRKMRRNEPCFCGSNKKFKHCHGRSA
ncbi:MAG TPA: SEC-C domain-containing protein [Methylocella sp.]|jgi:hypothetical protein